MSRRESRDHHGKRPSRFDRGPSPKKVRRDGQPTMERTYSRGRDLDADSAADRDQKHSRRLLDSSPLDVAPPLEKPVQSGTGKKDLDKKADELVDGMKHASYKKEDPRSRAEKEDPRSRAEKEATRSRDVKEVPRSRDGKEVPRFRDEKEAPQPRTEKKVPRSRDGKEVSRFQDEKEAPRPRNEKEIPRSRDGKEVPRFRDEKELPQPRNGKEVPRSRDGKEVPQPRNEKEVLRSRDGKEVPWFQDEKEVPRPRNEKELSWSRDGKEVPRPRNEKEVPQLQTYFQHDERDSAGHDGRRSGRRALDHGRWSDSKEQYSERARFKREARELQRKEERTLSNADDKKVWKHDKFSELEAEEVPPLRKRPAFSEKKMLAEPETRAAVKVSESTRMTHEIGVEGTRREERGSYHFRGLDKTDRPFSRVADERNGRRGDGHPQRAEMARPSYQQRERFHGGFTSGRDMPNGGYNVRNAYRPGGVQVDKWKHDLYAEANRSPTPKNEEDQIAKVEALLAL